MSLSRLTLLHIEDDPLWRDLIDAIVATLPEVARRHRACNGTEGRELARVLSCDIVLLDLRLPDADGLALGEELARLRPPPRILLLSARADDAVLFHATQPHVAGLVWKSPGTARLLPEAIRAIAAGRKYFPTDTRDALRRLRADPDAFYKILSRREIGLLPLFGLGRTDAQIAAALGLSEYTVKSHRQHIMAKLGLHRTPDLIRWAFDRGFVPSPFERGLVREDGAGAAGGP